MDQHQLDLTIAFLQTIQKEFPKFNDLSDKNRRAIFALAETNEQLSGIKRELETAKAGLTDAMKENEARHVASLKELQAQLSQVHHEIKEAKAELNSVEATLVTKRAEYEALMRGFADLRRRVA